MKNRHHVYPRRWRNGKTEIKKVDVNDHRYFHTLFQDYHPEDTLRKMEVVIFGKIYLSPTENYALGRLMKGRSQTELWDYLIENFLPTESYYLAHKFGETEVSPIIENYAPLNLHHSLPLIRSIMHYYFRVA